MRISVILFLLLLAAGTARADTLSAKTVEGYAACLEKEWLDDMSAFAAKNDQANFQAYLDKGNCILLKNGLPVTVTGSPGLLGTQAEFVYKGTKFWTVREALSDYKP